MSTDFKFLDDAMLALNKSASKGGKKNQEDRLPISFLGENDFTARIVWDKNKVLFHEFVLYKASLLAKNDKGEEVERKVYYRVPGLSKEDDPIRPYAEELEHFSYKPRFNIAFFADIVEVTRGQNEYFKPGPCILITSNRRFLNQLNSAMAIIAKKEKDGKPIGKELLAQTLDPTQPGMLINVRNTKGQSGSCSVQFDTIGGLEHTFKPDVIEKFDDITLAYCPPLGLENDRNGELIKEHYKKLLADKTTSADPDSDEAAAKAAAAIKSGTPKKPKPTGGTDESDKVANDLDNILTDLNL